MSVDYRLIGQRIQQQRKRKKKTQEQLAEQLSVTIGYVSQIERGVTKASLELLMKISYLLETDIYFLLTGSYHEESSYLNHELEERYSQLNDSQKRMLLEFMELLSRYSVSDTRKQNQ